MRLCRCLLACAAALSSLSASAADRDERSDVHGFLEVTLKNAYITPRGLVVHTGGATIQPLAGIVLVLASGGVLDSLSLSTGVWCDLNARQNAEYVGAWNEFDYFGGVSAKLAKRLELGVSYLLFTSPPHNFRPEHNVELKVALDDSGWIRSAAFRPYVKFFWAVAGDSTVVLGKQGGTWDAEFGLSPSYRLQAIRSYPISLALPTFLTLGSRSFFGGGGNVGVLSTGLSASAPLSFMPTRMGSWTGELGATYYHLVNDSLVSASRLLGNGGRRDELVGHIRIAMRW